MRECPPCSECCFHLNVAEAEAPAMEHCQHECSKGCAIYETRPSQCRPDVDGVEFNCHWKLGLLPWKPSKVGWFAHDIDDPNEGRWLQVHVRKNAKISQKAMAKFMNVSHAMPVRIIRDGKDEATYAKGARLIKAA